MRIRFTSYKHSARKVCFIFLPEIASPLCPVAAVKAYLRVWSSIACPLFLLQDNWLLEARNVRRVLHSLAEALGLPKGSLTPHVLRIGVATTAASLGLPDEIIARMGRWSSKAYMSYI